MLETINLRKVYKIKDKELVAVDNLNMHVEKGKITGLLGMNGAGKTTTIKMLTTLLKPTSGKVLYDGIDAEDDIEAVKRKINVISGGERGLYDRLTGMENMDYFGALYGVKDRAFKEELLRKVGLEHAINQPVEQYSKGMKQRLKIAKGLLNNPDYLFLDEPTIGLDIMVAHDFREAIHKMAHEDDKGVVLTTHYIAEAEELCDYLYIIDKGKCIASGTIQEVRSLLKDTGYTYTVNADIDLSSMQDICKVLNATSEKEGYCVVVKAESEIFNSLFEELQKCGITVTGIQKREASLDSVLYRIIEGNR